MGLIYRKRIRTGRRSWLNISRRGVSGSVRLGPLTLNSRGRSSTRIARGLSYRGGCATIVVIGAGAGAVLVAAITRL